MDGTIALFLLQDAVVNGAIYALVAIALVLVFAVTRVILIPQGEFVAFATLTLASLQAGVPPRMAWLLIAVGVLNAAVSLVRLRRIATIVRIAKIVGWNVLVPGAIAMLALLLAPLKLGLAINIIITLALIVPLGAILYDLAFDRLAEASVLTLLIVAFGVHIALTGLGLAFFGRKERTRPPCGARVSMSGRFSSAGRACASLASPSSSWQRSHGSSARRFSDRPCAPVPSTGLARGSSACRPRSRGGSHSASPH